MDITNLKSEEFSEKNGSCVRYRIHGIRAIGKKFPGNVEKMGPVYGTESMGSVRSEKMLMGIGRFYRPRLGLETFMSPPIPDPLMLSSKVKRLQNREVDS